MSATTRSVIVRLRAEMAQFKKEWNEGTGAVKGTRDELERTAKQSKQTARAVDESGTSVGKLSTTLKNNRQSWDEVGSSLLKTGAILTAVSALMAKAAIDWETAWTGVLKTVEGTPAQLEQIESGLRELAKTMPTSHQEIAAVAEAAGALGIKRDDIVGFTKTMVMLGDTTNLSAEQAATSIAQLMNVMQTAPDQVDNIGAALVALGNAGASTEDQIIQMAQRIAGAGEIVGLTEGDVLGLASALASSGIEVEAGGSAISSVLIDISKAVDTNSDKLGTWAKTSGMSADDFAAKWKADPASALTAFTEGLGQLTDNGESAFGVLDELGQSDIRVTRALLNMANAGGLLREQLAIGNTELERNQALVDEAGKRYDTAAAQSTIAWNNIKDNAIDAGQAMLPVISAVSDVVIALADAFGSLPDPVKAGLGILTGGAGATLLAAGAFMKVAGSVSDLRAAFVDLDVSGGRTVSTIGKIAKAAGVATLGIAALQTASKFRDDSESVATYTKAILELGDKGPSALEKLAGVEMSDWQQDAFGGLDGIARTLKEVKESGQGLEGFGSNLEGTLGLDAPKIVKDLEAMDQALSSLVMSGATDEAAKGFAYISEQAKLAGIGADDLSKLFPTYTDALADADSKQKLAANSAAELAGGSKALSMTLSELSPDATEASNMLAELVEGSANAAMGFVNLAENIDPAKESLDGWLDGLEKQRKAMDAWADNMIKAGTRGVSDGVLKEFEKLGPEGAAMLAELVDGSQKDIDRLNEIWGDAGNGAQTYGEIIQGIQPEVLTQLRLEGGPEAIEMAAQVAAQYGVAPDVVRTVLEAQDVSSEVIAKVLARLATLNNIKAMPTIGVLDAATGKIRQIQQLINGMNGKTVRVAVEGGTGGGITRNADGGAIEGPGGPREDNILSWVSSGEHVWTAAEVASVGGQGAMYAMRAAVRSGRRPTFADGGAGSDAWGQSFRSAAASYGAPVSSVAATAPIILAGEANGPVELGPESIRYLAQEQTRTMAKAFANTRFVDADGQTLRAILAGG